MNLRLFYLLALAACTALGEPNPWPKMRGIIPRAYVCQRAGGPIRIDGSLDDPAWAQASWTDDFVDIEGNSKPGPKFRTRAKMLWDKKYFYICAELEEPQVWATLTAHDAVIFQDNDFEFFIDPDGDAQEYYEFEINALNTTWDLLLKKAYKDGGPALNSWEFPGLKSAVHVSGTLNKPGDRDIGWSLEIAIPWKDLAPYAHRPAPPRNGDQWRINFSRVEWEVQESAEGYRKISGRREDNWVWSPTGIIDMHRPERWGWVQFTNRKQPGAYLPDPSLQARDALLECYYAQREYRSKNMTYAFSAGALNLAGNPPLMIKPAPAGYEATARDSKGRTWHIREDGRIWRTK